MDDTLAKQTGDIRDTWEGQCSPGRSARRASEGPPEVKKEVSITTNPARLTALQVACSVHALPGPCTPSKHAACGPAMPHIRARAAADPAPLRGGLAEGGGHTVPAATQLPSQITTQTQSVGLFGGEAVKSLVHMDAQIFVTSHARVLLSGKLRFVAASAME